MLVVRPFAVIEDGVEGREVCRIRIEPRGDVLGLDRDDAAVVAGGGNLCRRLIGDRGKGEKVRFTWTVPMRPQARNQTINQLQ